jgi:sugar phosphate permease
VIFSVLFGLDYIATVPPTVALVADVFGRNDVGIVYGWVYAAHMLGAAILAQVAAVIRDQAGNYTLAYLTAGFMAVAAGVVILALRRARLVAGPAPAAA